MKRVEESSTVHLPPVRFHVEDLEYMLQLLSKDMSVEIQHQKFSYESLADLQENIRRDSIDSLSVTAIQRDPQRAYVNIRIDPEGVRLYADPSGSERRAHVAEFLRSKVRWYSWTTNSPWWYALKGALAVAAATLVWLTISFSVPLPRVAEFVVPGLAAVLAFALSLGNRPWIGGSRVFLQSSLGTPTFWQRNRDAILVGVISGVVSFVAGYLSK
jgi:hypothetical protein